VQSNFIQDNGLDGVAILDGAAANLVGGNLIFGNGGDGVRVAAAAGNQVEGNYIGIDETGVAAPNVGYGVRLTAGARDNLVGAMTPAWRNLIGGNALGGVRIEGAGTADNRVEGNWIGLNPAGTGAIPNGGAGGVSVAGTAGPNEIGAAAGVPQVISGNAGAGVHILGASGVLIGGANWIGTVGGAIPPGVPGALGNGGPGVYLEGVTGVTVTAEIVAYNGGAGVAVAGAAQALVLPRRALGNSGLPVDLGNDGPTANDPGDADGGPNGRLNYPVATGGGGGSLMGTACGGCAVHLYRAAGNPGRSQGGGAFLLAVTADGAGVWSAAVPAEVNPATVTLVAVDAAGNSSEMSPRPVLFVPLVRG
jgi:parallel beta-helix repeat protein